MPPCCMMRIKSHVCTIKNDNDQVLVWSAASFIISFSNGGAAPPGVPRRVSSGDVWDATGDSGGGGGGGGGTKTWHVARRMAEVPGGYIAAALIPALVITVLFYFGKLLHCSGTSVQ